MKRSVFFALLTCLFFSILAFTASASTTDELYSQANSLWEKRDNYENVVQALDLFEKIAAQNPNDTEIRILMGRASFWLFQLHLGEKKKIKVKKITKMLERGITACEQVLEKESNNVGARYWLMMTNGAKNYHENMFDWDLYLAIQATIYIAKGNVNYNNGGIYRYWGNIMYRAPKIIGRLLSFSTDKTIWLYLESLKTEPKFLSTRVALAECYIKNDEEPKARQELENVLKTNPEVLPEYGPENRLAQKNARKILADL